MSLLRKLRLRPPNPPIVLLTDFGLADHYVGTMKGVIASINPQAKIIDLSHDVDPQDTRQAAYLLWSAYRFFPEKTIFVSVVDPGVGSSRRILGMQTRRALFLVPENEILDLVLQDEEIVQCVEAQTRESRFVLRDISQTFHGRDVFAPIAAYLSAGVPLSEIGSPAIPPSPALSFVSERGMKGGLVLHVDRFGNIITNVRPERAEQVKALSIGKIVVHRWIRSYDEAPARQVCLIMGSSGLVEIVLKNASAAAKLRAVAGMPIRAHWS